MCRFERLISSDNGAAVGLLYYARWLKNTQVLFIHSSNSNIPCVIAFVYIELLLHKYYLLNYFNDHKDGNRAVATAPLLHFFFNHFLRHYRTSKSLMCFDLFILVSIAVDDYEVRSVQKFRRRQSLHPQFYFLYCCSSCSWIRCLWPVLM